MATIKELVTRLAEGQALAGELESIDWMINKFRAVTGDTVQCRALALVPGEELDPRSHLITNIEMLPVSKENAISAIERRRSKIISKLAELGITEEK